MLYQGKWLKNICLSIWMNYFAYGITSKSNVEQVLPKNPKSWFPNVLFAHLQATTQII